MKIPKKSDFVKDQLELYKAGKFQGAFSATELRQRFIDLYHPMRKNPETGKLEPDTVDAGAFFMALKRVGVTHEELMKIRDDSKKAVDTLDILEYPEVKKYVEGSEDQHVGSIEQYKQDVRHLWQIMSKSNPRFWSSHEIFEKLKENTEDYDKKTQTWLHPYKMLSLLGVFNRCFPGVLNVGWSVQFKREPGELKDYFRFDEFDEFLRCLQPTANMVYAGWVALYETQVSSGAREGTDERTGILSLTWESIDFDTRRCTIHEKGKRGKPGRLWSEVPLDLFPWRKAWDCLMTWWNMQGKPSTGRCFPVSYDEFRNQFHESRKRANGRISGDKETFVPHIMRKTHAQWCCKMHIPEQWICGLAGVGRYGVGWDDPKVFRSYYGTLETDEMQEIDAKMTFHAQKLGLLSA